MIAQISCIAPHLDAPFTFLSEWLLLDLRICQAVANPRQHAYLELCKDVHLVSFRAGALQLELKLGGSKERWTNTQVSTSAQLRWSAIPTSMSQWTEQCC